MEFEPSTIWLKSYWKPLATFDEVSAQKKNQTW